MTATATLRQRIEVAEFTNSLNVETFTAERESYRGQISNLHARIRKAEMLIAQLADVLDSSVVEVVDGFSGHHRVTLRAIVEDFEERYHWPLCTVCSDVECSGAESHEAYR